jgi:ArsR family transcriptional regulator, arsenate/arsenite/antimonite-responsive transcriptional repressor
VCYFEIVNRRLTMKSQRKDDIVCCDTPELEPEADMRPVEGAAADEELAALAKAVAHPARVRILRLLSHKEARVCSQIVGELPLAQSTVSEHLRILKEAGLIRSREEGSRIGYCINFPALRRLKALVAIL